MPIRKVLSEIFVYLIALLWLYTSVYKFLQIDNSISQLGDSPLIAPFAVWFGYGLPVIEFALFALLLISKTRRYALIGSTILLTLFTIYIIVILNFYRADTPCTCGGIISKLGWKNHIYFNLTFLLMGVYVLIEPYLKSDKQTYSEVSMKHT